MIPFKELRPMARALLVLMCVGFVHALFGLMMSAKEASLGVLLMGIIEIVIFVGVFFCFQRRLKPGWWIMLISASLSLITLLLKIVLLVRLSAVLKEMPIREVLGPLALRFTLPLILFPLLLTYDVRRHFRVVERR